MSFRDEIAIVTLERIYNETKTLQESTDRVNRLIYEINQSCVFPQMQRDMFIRKIKLLHQIKIWTNNK